MEDLLLKVEPFLESAAYFLMVLVVLGTVISRITPTPKDDKIVSSLASYVLKLIRFLPTFGINPETKKLEKAYKELKEKDEASKSS